MRPADVVGFALGSLLRGRLRTALMLLATSIGVAAVVLLTGVGEGARRYVVNEFASLGTNLLIIIPGRAETSAGMPSTFVGETPRDLTIADAMALARSSLVRHLAPVSIGEMSISHQGLERRVPVLGSTAELLPIRHLTMGRGRFLPNGDPETAQPVCVLGSKVHAELFGDRPAVGEIVRLGEHRCRVLGVLSSEGQSLHLATEEVVIVPVAFAQMLLDTRGLFRIMIEARDRDALPRLQRFVTDTIALRHYGERDITLITQDSVLSTFDDILQAITLSVAGIAAISLVVAGILIMNVMLVSVTQRTAEIGLLKAVGARNGQVVAVVLTEAALLALLGGLLGLWIGMAGGWAIEQYYPDLGTRPPPWAVAAALGTALLVGLVSGLLPARRAARLNPVEALARR